MVIRVVVNVAFMGNAGQFSLVVVTSLLFIPSTDNDIDYYRMSVNTISPKTPEIPRKAENLSSYDIIIFLLPSTCLS